jgi:hypothetical protein
MDAVTFLSRARRALKKPPRDIAARCWEAGKRRAQRPWATVVPRLRTTRALARETGAADVDALWTRLARQPFFVQPAARSEWAARFAAAYPASRDTIVADADRVLRHEFDLLGSGPVPLGARLPWRTDFKSGREWPLQYCADIEFYDLEHPSDVKVPWELSRCQHFVRLGQAYWLTGDDRYPREFAAEVADWIAANPYAWSVNWICAMDVALRAVSWIWGFYLMADSEPCRSRTFRDQFLRSLLLHGEFIATHLERGPVNGNHYLCDGVGLVFLGCFFGDSRRGRAWRGLGRDIVVSEIFNQVYPDGVDFEQSVAYHRLVLEAFATSFMLLERHGDPAPPDASARLRRMYDYVAAYTKPDGRAPLIGDADDGRIQTLGTQRLGDHRYLLSTAAVTCADRSLKAAAGEFWDESFWLLGPDGLDRFAALTGDAAPPSSVAFNDGGFFVLRGRDTHAIVDCGDVGMRGIGGHGHNDILSFELFMNGVNVVTDCGAYLYTASREWRNRFRSTAFHNTLQVDGEELNRFISADQLWQLRYDAVPVAAELRTRRDAGVFRGAHRGYERLDPPVAHTRELIVANSAIRVVVRDLVETAGAHTYVWRFHLDPDVVAAIDGDAVTMTSAGRRVWLLPDAVAARFVLTLEPGWVSPRYGVMAPTTVVTWRGDASHSFVASFLFADEPLDAAARARAIDELAGAV